MRNQHLLQSIFPTAERRNIPASPAAEWRNVPSSPTAEWRNVPPSPTAERRNVPTSPISSIPLGILRNATMLETHLETESDIDTTAPESPLDAPYHPEAHFELNIDREVAPLELRGKKNLSLSVVPEYSESVSGLGSGLRIPSGKLDVPYYLPHSPSKYRIASSFLDGREEESYPIRTPSGMCTPMELASPLKQSMASPFRFNLSEMATAQLKKKNTQRCFKIFGS